MSSPLVSIITPVFNGESYLANAIESALSQSYSNFELLIINDGSTDNSHHIVKTYLNDKRVHYFDKTNGGVASARNHALRHAQGEYIGFLDQDDRWLPHKLALQVDYLERHREVALHYAKQQVVDARGVASNFDWPTGASGYCLPEIFLRNKITILTTLVRKSVIEQVGFFNEALSGTDDYDMWLRVLLKHPIHFDPQIVAEYRLHDMNVSLDSFKMTIRDLETITTFLSEHPESRSIIGPAIIRTRLFELNAQLAAWYTWKNKDFKRARAHYLASIKQKPLQVKSYTRWLYCRLSDTQRRKLSWYHSKINHWLQR